MEGSLLVVEMKDTTYEYAFIQALPILVLFLVLFLFNVSKIYDDFTHGDAVLYVFNTYSIAFGQLITPT